MMNPVSHSITHVYQPSGLSCGQSAVTMLLSHYGVNVDVNDVIRDVPLLKNDEGKDWGTFAIDLALYCKKKGFVPTYVSFDSLITEPRWIGLSSDEILEKLKQKQDYVVAAVGKNLSASFVRSYIEYLAQGGALEIKPTITSSSLYELLQHGPFITCIAFSALYARGGGTAATHFIVVYGNDEQGNFLIADPWEKPGRHVVEPEKLISAIMATQMTCENGVLTIEP